MAQVALVVHPAAGHALAQPELFEQVLHLVRMFTGHGQVVRAQRAGDAAHGATPAVATGAVFELQQREIVHAALAQRPRRSQARHAAARDQGVDAAGDGRWAPQKALAG